MPKAKPDPKPGAYVIVDDPDDPFAFSFAPRVAPGDIPPEQKKVISAATEHYTKILDLVEDEKAQNDWLLALKQIVSLGAVQPETDPAGALAQIKKRDDELVKGLRSFLEPAVIRFVKAAARLVGLSAAIGIALRLVPPEWVPKFDVAVMSNYALAGAASLVALILQYYVAAKLVTLKSYPELKADLSSPVLDVLACFIMCVIVIALLASGAVSINIKGLETSGVETNARTAIVVGLICGLSSRRLGPVLLNFALRVAQRLR